MKIIPMNDNTCIINEGKGSYNYGAATDVAINLKYNETIVLYINEEITSFNSTSFD